MLNKESSKLIKLEKGSSKMEGKAKMGGFGGMENGYTLEGSKSTVRLNSGNSLSFVINTGSTSSGSNPQTDSVMRANGMDPSIIANSIGMMNDPSQTISLYNMNSEKSKRKVIVDKPITQRGICICYDELW